MWLFLVVEFLRFLTFWGDFVHDKVTVQILTVAVVGLLYIISMTVYSSVRERVTLFRPRGLQYL